MPIFEDKGENFRSKLNKLWTPPPRKPAHMVYVYNTRTRDVKARELPQIWDQSGVNSEFQASVGYLK